MMVEEYARLVHRLSLDLYKRLNLLLFMNGRSTHGLPFKLEFIEGGKAAHFCYHINPPDSRSPAYLFAYYLYFLLIHFRPSLNDSGACCVGSDRVPAQDEACVFPDIVQAETVGTHPVKLRCQHHQDIEASLPFDLGKLP